MASTVEDKARDLEKLAEFYEAVTGTHVPDSVAAGVAEGWELAETFGVMPGYDATQRAADRQRVMTLHLALQTLEEFEETLMQTQVVATLDVIWTIPRGAWALVTILARYADRIWDGLVDVWNIGGFLLASWWESGALPDFSQLTGAVAAALGAAWAGLDEAVGLLIFAWKEVHFREMLTSISKVRDASAEKARKRAFPQSTVGRVRRRKVARL